MRAIHKISHTVQLFLLKKKRSSINMSKRTATSTPFRSGDAEAGLRKYFPAHSTFKPGQEQVIRAILRGESAAAIFPTGGGKSLCYQLPGLLLQSEGLTLVVSPLLALMKDQVDALQKKGHPADLLASSLSLDEKIAVKNRVRNRQTAILYVAPEQLNNENSMALIRSIPIALLAIDESHCISEWGHAFRPDYLRLAKLRQTLGVDRVLALTATATPKVQADICQAFRISPDNLVRTAFFRPNLKFAFTPVSMETRDNILIQTIHSRPPGSTIVYATLQKTTEAVAKSLQQAGIEARAYHAGMKQEDRKETQEWFMAMTNQRRVVVATIAFGMGVDKCNIRYIYHYNLPKSLEGYAQEVGRAGRDGEDSHCEVLCCMDDVPQLEAFAFCGSPSKRAIKGVLGDVFRRQDGSKYRPGAERAVSHYSLARAHDLEETGVRMLLAFVDIYHGLIRQGTPRYTVYKVKPRRGHVSETPQMLRSSGDAAAGETLARYCNVKRTWAHIDVGDAAATGTASRESLLAAIARLEENGSLEVMPSQVENIYYIEKQPNDFGALVESEFERFQTRQTQELARIGQVLAFITANDCLAKVLTEHFEGGGGPSSSTSSPFPCGKCHHCQTGKPVSLPHRGGSRIDPTLWKQLENDPNLPRDDPLLIARFALGFKSPRINQLRLTNHCHFGLFEGAPFQEIMAMVAESFFTK